MTENDRNQTPNQDLSLLTAVLETSGEMIAVLEADLRIIAANTKFLRLWEGLYGTTVQAGDDLAGILPEEPGRLWARFVQKTLTGGRQVAEHPYVIDGQRCDVQWTADTKTLGQGATGIVLVGRDLTAHRIIEEALRERGSQLHHSQKMAAVGTLAGGVAHEFNNALSIVLGSLELSEMDIEAAHPGRPYLDEAKAGILRAKKVAQQLLDFSRKTDGRPKEVNLHDITANALDLLRASIPTHIEFHPLIDPCPPILGEPSHLHQLIVNLCTNAADAMDREGGMLTVILERIRLRADNLPAGSDLAPGAYAKLTVADTGSGIAAEHLPRIFEPLFTTKGSEMCTGMGLAVVNGIVNTHDGAITVQSQPGQGSKFEVYLPTHPPVREMPAGAKPVVLGGTERILFVDDEPKFVMITQRQLEQLGYRLEAYTSPQRALEQFRNAPEDFDLVITDVAMPKITGDKLINQIRQIRPAIPAILLTGYSEKVDRQTADQIGCEYAIKPIERDDLARLVRNAIEGKSDPAANDR